MEDTSISSRPNHGYFESEFKHQKWNLWSHKPITRTGRVRAGIKDSHHQRSYKAVKKKTFFFLLNYSTVFRIQKVIYMNFTLRNKTIEKTRLRSLFHLTLIPHTYFGLLHLPGVALETVGHCWSGPPGPPRKIPASSICTALNKYIAWLDYTVHLWLYNIPLSCYSSKVLTFCHCASAAVVLHHTNKFYWSTGELAILTCYK